MKNSKEKPNKKGAVA